MPVKASIKGAERHLDLPEAANLFNSSTWLRRLISTYDWGEGSTSEVLGGLWLFRQKGYFRFHTGKTLKPQNLGEE